MNKVQDKLSEQAALVKPLLRGHLHQGAFFVAVGAASVLIATAGPESRPAVTVYAISLVVLFGISSLYHRINWSPRARMWMRRLDHSAIFIQIAGTVTPVSLLALPHPLGLQLCLLFWGVAAFGVLQSLFWVHAPKWLSALLYIGMGWLVAPFMSDLAERLAPKELVFLVAGGVIYTLGALVYAFKRPNPAPAIFGYHEIFHALVVLAAALHFVVVFELT